MKSIKVHQAGKRFDRRWIFRNLSFELNAREIIAICGNNGSGKSTLLKAIAGLLPLSEGSIEYPSEEMRDLLGYSGIDAALYGELTVAEHVKFAADLQGFRVDVGGSLAFVELDYAANRLVRELSTGMRSRLRLALAVLTHPPFLLLDEPGAALDQAGTDTLNRIIELQSQTGTVVIATNDPKERSLATKVIDLEQELKHARV